MLHNSFNLLPVSPPTRNERFTESEILFCFVPRGTQHLELARCAADTRVYCERDGDPQTPERVFLELSGNLDEFIVYIKSFSKIF